MTEAQALLASGGGFIIINIIGWAWTFYRNGKKDAYYRGVMTEQLNNFEDKFSDLPCQIDPHYSESRGALTQHMKDVDSRLMKLEQKTIERR